MSQRMNSMEEYYAQLLCKNCGCVKGAGTHDASDCGLRPFNLCRDVFGEFKLPESMAKPSTGFADFKWEKG